MSRRDFSESLDGLDSYCETIRGDIDSHAENLKSVNFDAIPSKTQREGLTLLVALLGQVESIAALLRYDVCADHTDCPEHDDYMRRHIDGARRWLSGLNDEERHLIRVCVDRYIADIRKACSEDQGDAEGKPGTVGNEMQTKLKALRHLPVLNN